MNAGKCTIVEKLPGPEEYNFLRHAVGWGTYRKDVIEKSLPNSLYCVCAFVMDELVGMARVVGDDGLVYYVQDVIVVPDCQRQGIGAQLMERIMSYIETHASQNSVIGLMSARGKEAFYEKYGFTNRPNDRFGSGMTVFREG
jgi:GNAT superfamily N-acetyltransferase